MTGMFRALCAAAVCVGAFSVPAAADAVSDFYAGKRISFVVGVSAGGTYDLYTRTFADHVGKHIPGKPGTIVINMPGGGGVKAMNYLYNAAPRDGTVLAMPEQGIPIAKALREDPGLKFDVSKVNWIGTLSRSYYFFGIWADRPVKTIDDAKKVAVPMSSTGRNSTTAIYPMLANAALGTRFQPVLGYKGAGDMNMAIEQGETWGRGGTWISWHTATRHWIAGKKLRFVLQIGTAKHPDAPDVPLLLDLVKDPEVRDMVSFMSVPTRVGRSIAAPPAVPADRLAALRRAFDATVKDPAFLADAKKRGLDITGEPGIELQALMARLEKTPKSLVDKIRVATKVKASGKSKKK